VPGRIEVRLAGRDPELVYIEEEEPERAQTAGADDAFSARITLRLPEGLKAQLEVAANLEGTSVNAWIVRALQRGLEPRTRSVRTGRRLSGYADS
jgi:predicted HicB family RNase H-like nuclease